MYQFINVGFRLHNNLFSIASMANLVVFQLKLLLLQALFKLVVQGLREIGVSYCVHNVTTAVLPSTKSMETLSSGHIIYTIGHTYFPKSLDTVTESLGQLSGDPGEGPWEPSPPHLPLLLQLMPWMQSEC